MDTTETLRYDYRKTWEAFSLITNSVHKLALTGDKAALETAMLLADKALTAHKEARDRLAAAMVPSLAFPPAPTGLAKLPGRDSWPTHRSSQAPVARGVTA